MHGKFSGWDDTIAALATPQGIGAIGVIRVSGEKAVEIVDELFPSKNLGKQASHTLHVGYIVFEDVVLDEVVISLFKAPRSYTGEDVVEISCHGSPYIQQQVLQALLQSGARAAKPGEFTQRAFLNGKLDLAQAEAVADLIASNTEASRRAAIQNIRGGFSHALQQVRDELLQFSALIELELDFSQEDVEFADRSRLYALLYTAGEKVRQLLLSFKLGNVIKNGVQVAIIGKPNAGKSTLLNTLLNEERAIVSDIAGTTRDTIEEVLNIKGILFRLADTAGIRSHSADIIENLGMEKSMEKMRNADIVIYLYDVNETGGEELKKVMEDMQQRGIRFLLVGNKADAGTQKEQTGGSVYISAKNNINIDELKDKLFNAAVQEQSLSQETLVTNTRHIAALEKVDVAMNDIIQGLDNKLPGDLLSADIRTCLHYLGEITGEITNEHQLDYIFSKFCIGK
ncbi:MAG TPA: tRNA uridine-5-carboxymethylaminomethyl(34) synthesis GTPase MnmE [Chitinophagaceae bacterium]|nr:tRNA uridine-5-carboxymethylaminomethyl(34) synthesis GTPase MnmE [Chitinophagaceae bacterium]